MSTVVVPGGGGVVVIPGAPPGMVVVPGQSSVITTGLPGQPGPMGPPGKDGTSVVIVDSVPTAADLPVLTPGDAGDGYITEDDGHLHVWDGDSWTDVGNIQGPPGPIGPPGPNGDYRFVQATPSATWTIAHGLSFQPNVTVVDSAGAQVEGDIAYVGSTVVVTFSVAFAGTAYLS